MKIIHSSIAIAAALVVGLASCVSKSDGVDNGQTQTAKKAENDAEVMLPAFKMTDVHGNIVDMASLKGKKIFVNLWATWCPPCRAEIPSIEALNSKVDKNRTAFVMLSLDKDFELAKRYAKIKNLESPVYSPAEALPSIFNTDGIPATFIFNENGKLVKQNTGPDDYDTDDYYRMLSQ